MQPAMRGHKVARQYTPINYRFDDDGKADVQTARDSRAPVRMI